MPLVMVTGLPTSGKSTRAKQLYDYLADKTSPTSSATPNDTTNPASHVPSRPSKYRLHLISDQTLSISRTVYDLDPENIPRHTRSANASEKDARAALQAAVKRVLSARDIVILDGLNYIKGWRYQLHTEAKNLSTPSVVLQIGCGVERARVVNAQRLARQAAGKGPKSTANDEVASLAERTHSAPVEEDDDESAEGAYSPSNWDNLVFRYEEPNPMARWDRPLFTLIWDDDTTQTHRVFDDIWEAIAGENSKKVRPNQAAIQRGESSDAGNGDYLQMLNRETKAIIDRILAMQGDEGGGQVKIPKTGKLVGDGRGIGGAAEDLVLELPMRRVTLPMLNQYTRDFTNFKRAGIGLENARARKVGEQETIAKLREAFVWHLNNAFERVE